MIKNQRGFTLIEVLAAIAILSIITVTFIFASGYTTLAFSNSDMETEAIRLAERELNKKMNDQLTVTEENGYTVTVNESIVTPLLNSYSNPVPIDSLHHVSLQGLKIESNQPVLIIVTVSWGEQTP